MIPVNFLMSILDVLSNEVRPLVVVHVAEDRGEVLIFLSDGFGNGVEELILLDEGQKVEVHLAFGWQVLEMSEGNGNGRGRLGWLHGDYLERIYIGLECF